VRADLITRCFAAAAESGAAVAALASRDTVKQATDERLVLQTLPRERIYLAQTPQVFSRRVLREALALAEAGEDATDESTLAERAGHPVRIVEGEPTNIKITVPEDVPMAEMLANEASPTVTEPGWRVGTGYDLHRLVEGRPLILGGITIPFERGLLGHSDADAVCHAMTDALLGAAALGDIGRHFPDTDPQYAGASSLHLLRRAVALLAEAGYGIVNVDVTVIAQRPKLAPHIDAMRRQLAGILDIPVDRVGLKGKTNEGVDAVGRGEAIATHAVALIYRRVPAGSHSNPSVTS
jgi:2-C-methyl-D-erythritol 2,4-cyclodiphosphate synthase